MSPDIREMLFKCYSPHAYDIFRLLSDQGFREQENIQLDWQDIRFDIREINIKTSKNGESRSVPMYKRSFWILARIWIKAGRPAAGKVFLNQFGQPYTDTRLTCGGSPLRKAHILALARFKEKHGFIPKNSLNKPMRVHDHRHDWASRCVMAGVDLLTLQRLGGWKSIEMVKRYASFSKQHEHDAISKI